MKFRVFLTISISLACLLPGSTFAQTPRTISVVGAAPEFKGKPLYADSWALVIGVNRYKDSRIPELSFAEADAYAVALKLLPLGFPESHIVRIIGPQATREGITKAIERLDRRMGPEDRLFVFMAGHGVTLKIKGKETGYFLPYDAEIDRFPRPGERYVGRRPGNALAMGTFLTDLGRLQPKHTLLAMDSCFSGFARQRAFSPPKVGRVNDRRLAAWARESVVQVLTAGKAGETAAEHQAYGHGIFTYHLLRGLQGNADSTRGNADGLLTFTELLGYVKDKVTSDERADQDPQYAASGDGEFLFPLSGEPIREGADGSARDGEDRRRFEAERRRLEAQRARMEAARRRLEAERRRFKVERERVAAVPAKVRAAPGRSRQETRPTQPKGVMAKLKEWATGGPDKTSSAPGGRSELNRFLDHRLSMSHLLLTDGTDVGVDCEEIRYYVVGHTTLHYLGDVLMGLMHLRGRCVGENPREALLWLRNSAELGSSDAKFFLGVMHVKGIGVPKDLIQAKEWFKKAAEQDNNPDAQYAFDLLNGKPPRKWPEWLWALRR